MHKNNYNKIDNLEKTLNYCFKNKKLLLEAITHPSYKQKNSNSLDYERLEFFGDTIINFVISKYLFKNFTSYSEGQLARARISLVCKEALGQIALKINLSQFLFMTEGEAENGGRKNINNLENALEAIIAAIYLDSNLENIEKIILYLWKDFLNQKNFQAIDPRSELQEFSQKFYHKKPEYILIKKEGMAHMPFFTVKVVLEQYHAIGEANSLKLAKKKAAKNILTLLKA